MAATAFLSVHHLRQTRLGLDANFSDPMDGCTTQIVRAHSDANRRFQRLDASGGKWRTLITLCGRLLHGDAKAVDENGPWRARTLENPSPGGGSRSRQQMCRAGHRWGANAMPRVKTSLRVGMLQQHRLGRGCGRLAAASASRQADVLPDVVMPPCCFGRRFAGGHFLGGRPTPRARGLRVQPPRSSTIS